MRDRIEECYRAENDRRTLDSRPSSTDVSFRVASARSTRNFSLSRSCSRTGKNDPLLTFIRDASAGRCYNIGTVQELLGHSGTKTTMI